MIRTQSIVLLYRELMDVTHAADVSSGSMHQEWMEEHRVTRTHLQVYTLLLWHGLLDAMVHTARTL